MVLNPVISKLANKLVVLASASPRRQDILRNAGLKFEVVPSWFKETLDKRLFKAPHEYAVETAKQKALEVARRMPLKHLKTPDMVIGADTIVTVDGLILEKPVDKHDAYRMLSSLSGKEHSVYTGVAIILCHDKENEEVDYQLVDFYEETKVKFADLSESMLWEYINSGEPMDKAGGYGIQALGGMLVECVHGDFLNVVGFPLNRFCKQLDLIYNQSTSSSDGESPSVDENSSAAKHSPSSSSSKHTHHHKTSPSASPLHKVKRTGGDAGAAESALKSVNSSSNQADVSDATSPLMTSRGQLSGQEDGDPKKEGLKKIMALLDGFKASKTLFTASSLGVFDLLQSKPGLDAEQVAQEMKASVKGTVCLLEACVSLGLLRTKEQNFQKPVYENTDLSSRYLLSDAPLSLHGYIQHCDRTIWHLFSHLESAVKEGSSQHDKAFGKMSKDMFQDLFYYNQEAKLRFMNAMHSITKVTGRDVATAFDLSSFKTACDLGGCTGAMAFEFTKAHPDLSVTVFDLPAVIEMRKHFPPLHKDDRVTFVAGDFFKDELPKADLYILARILHDWPDEKVNVLLKRISDACRPGCAVLIAETTVDGRRAHPALQSLSMLAQTEGRERTERQYVDLLSGHGFGDTRLVHTGNFLDALLSVKM